MEKPSRIADVLGRARTHAASVVAGRRAAGGDDRAEGREEHVGEAATHGLAHEAREQDARGADERARDDQQVRAEREARRRDRQSGEGVEQRDQAPARRRRRSAARR